MTPMLENTNSLAKDTLAKAASLLGRKGGLARSEKKAKAVRKNGKKGGRPPKSGIRKTA